MKTLYKSITAMMAAAAALTACQKELAEPDYPCAVEFSIEEMDDPQDEEAADPEEVETKTIFGTPSGTSVPVLWTTNQKVFFFYNGTSASGSGTGAGVSADVTPSSDKKTAKINKKVDVSTLKSVQFRLVSPYSCVTSHTISQTEISIPGNQTPTASSPDEKAMVLGAKTAIYTQIPAKVTFSPKHMTSYICLTLNNADRLGTLKTVTVTATVPLSGKAVFDFNATNPKITAASSGTAKSVTVNTTNKSNIWIACLPAQVAGTKLTITANGTNRTTIREITVPSGKNLTAGKVAVLSVDIDTDNHPTSVSLNKTSLALAAGNSETLTATVLPTGISNSAVTWSSSNTSVATVSSSGLVKAIKEGNATITVTTVDGGKTATCAVKVSPPAPRTVTILNKTDDPLYDDDALHITPTINAVLSYRITYTDGSVATNSGARVTVDSGSGVMVSSDGRTLKCTSVAQEATVKIAAYTSGGSISGVTNTINVKTWSDPTSVSYAINTPAKDLKWVLSATNYTLNATVSPSTARQKVEITVPSDKSYWKVTRANDRTFTIKDPNEHNFGTANEHINTLNTTFTISVWQKPSVRAFLTLCPTTIDISKPKLFDYVAYNSSTHTYKIIDGGLRVLFKTAYGTSHYKVKDIWLDNVSLSVPSGYKIVGIVTTFFTGEEVDYPTTTGLVNPYELVTYGPNVGGTTGTLLTSGKIHGFAISMYNAVASKWCAENDYVDGNANWSRELTNAYGGNSILSGSSQQNMMNGFNLTIAAHQYNVWRGSSHSILPANMVWNYGEPGYELNCCPFPKSNSSLTWVMRPWFVPTIWNWDHIADKDGKLYNTTVMKTLNSQIEKAGFGNAVFPYSTDAYWTINEVNTDKTQAYIVYSEGPAPRAKSGSAGVRPFLIF